MAIGMAGRSTKKKKSRQNVKRHWKPSLGRFVEHYDRRGEHARRKEMAAARRRTEALSKTTRHPRMGRRLVISACVFAAMLAVIGGFRLARHGSAAVVYDVLPARKPAIVKLDHGPVTRVVTATAAEVDAMVRAAVASVRATGVERPDRLIVIDPVSPAISFGSLARIDQRVLRRHAGPDAAHVYETAVARFLERVVDGLANRRVSVLGLPVEPGAAGIEAARRTNRRYGNVIERLDHLVTAHVFFRTESWVTEQRMVEEAIPEALHHAGTRPIVFRLNLEWRVLIDRAEVARYRRAEWNTLAPGG